MARSKSSHRWLKEHFQDEYVKRAQREGYRSRAVYKLTELQEKYRLIKPGMTVVDLGAAPGGWSQYALEILGSKGQIIAMDLLPIEPLPGVILVQGDFREAVILQQLLNILEEKKVELVLSDIAPNISGVNAVDIPRAMYLAELAVDFATQILAPGGGLLIKVFQGEGSDQLLHDIKARYDKVVVRKPKASRPRSREVYVLARGHKVV